jgi:hypothetical protein
MDLYLAPTHHSPTHVGDESCDETFARVVVLEDPGIAISGIIEQRLVPKYDEGSSSRSNEGIADLSIFDMNKHQRR